MTFDQGLELIDVFLGEECPLDLAQAALQGISAAVTTSEALFVSVDLDQKVRQRSPAFDGHAM